MRGPGRPKIDPMKRLQRRLTTSVTTVFDERFNATAARLGVTAPELLRRAAAEAARWRRLQGTRDAGRK